MTDRVAARVRQIGSVRENGRIQEVARLYLRDDIPDEDCWVCLTYR
jgi:hypothetical protein